MKKILSILAVLLCMAAIPRAYAYNFESGGIYYDITSPNTVAVTYATGSYNSYSGNVSIPSTVNNNGTHYTVTAIGNSAFRNCSNLTGVTIPGTVESIGEYAFYQCYNLSSVTMSNGVKTIGANAFAYTSLTSVTIPNTVLSIGGSAFSWCSNLTTFHFNADSCTFAGDSPYYGIFWQSNSFHHLVIGNNVKVIPDYTFAACSSLDSASVPNSVTRIGNYAFYDCPKLSYLRLSQSLTSIGDFAFALSDSLSSVTIPASVSIIGEGIFSGCVNLSSLDVASGSASYDSRNNCKAIIHTTTNTLVQGCKNTTIPNTVKKIANYAFSGHIGLSEVILPNSIISIGEYAFSGCLGLTGALIISDSIKSIGGGAFKNCYNISSITIGKAVDTIGCIAFASCGNISVYYKADSCVFGYTSYESYPFHDTHINSLTFGNNVKVIPSRSFCNCGLTGMLLIPNSVKYIGDEAFAGCSGLSSSLILPDTLTYIGYGAFSSCSGLTGNLVIPRSVTYIGHGAFASCSGLSSLDFNADSCSTDNDESTYSGYLIFSNCTGIISIHIGDSTRIIPARLFDGINNVDSVTIPRLVSSIGMNAFGNISAVTFNADSCTNMGTPKYTGYVYPVFNSNLTSLKIGNNVKIIPADAFKSTGITGALIIPDSVKVIGDRAFESCSNLDTVIIGNSVDTIGNSAFSNSGIESLILGNSVKTINASAFYNCYELTGTILIPNSVRVIDGAAFYKCYGIDSLVIGKSVKTMGVRAFGNCTGLTYIEFKADSCENTPAGVNTNCVFSGCNNSISLQIGDNVKTIPSGLFASAGITGMVVIPDSVVSIGYRAFNNCTNLSGTLDIPNSVTTIGGQAFSGCSGIDTLVIGRGVTYIGSSFDGCSGLTTLFFNADSCISMLSTQSNGYYTSSFYNCTNLANLTIGANVKYIPQLAFDNCSHLTGTIIIPDSLKTICSNAFSGCTGIDTLIIGKGVQSIGYNAFKGCTQLTNVNFNADSCITMMMGAGTSNNSNYTVFNGCTNITSLNIGENVKNIPAYTFYGLSNISGTLTIPDSVVSIGGYAFNGCSGYTSLSLGRSVDTIGQRAFPGNIVSIYSYRETPPAIDKTVSYQSYNNVSRSTPVYVPCGSAQSYRNAWTYSTSNTNSYFYNIYETLQPYAFSALSSDTLHGTVQVTTQATCTDPAVIEATPNFFYVFDHWSDGNTDNPRTITLTQDTTLVAHFREYTVTVVSNDTAAGAAYLTAQPTLENPQATVTAQTTDSCYVFAGWSNGSTDNPLTISVSQDTTLTAIFNSVVNLQFSAPATVCQGDSAILVATGADSYLWFNGETSTVISILPENTMEVSVTGTNQNGCSTTKRHQIGVLPKPTLTLSGSTDICEGESTTITCSGTPQTIFFEGFENTLSSEWWNWGENGASWYSTIGTSIDAYEGERAYAHNGNGFNYLLSPTIHVPEDGLTLSWTAKQIREDGFNAAYYIYVNYVNNPSISNILYDYYYDNMLEEYWEERSIDLSDLAGQDIRLAFGQTYGDWNGFGTVIIDNIRLSGNPDFVWSDGYIGYQRSLNVDGIWQVSISDNNGCTATDSVTISIWQPDTTELTVTAPTAPYTLNGETFCTSGDYTQTLQNIHGCDSVVNLHLTVPSDTMIVYDTLCAGSKLIQQILISPKEYQQLLTTLEYQYGNTLPFELSYDSLTHIVTAKQVSISFHEQWETGYNEYGYPTYGSFDTTLYLNYNDWKDSAYYDNFSYTVSYPSSSGCDSTVTWHRRILFSDNANYFVSACGRHIWQGDSLFGWNDNTGDYQIYHAGDTLTQSGDYAQAYTCANGCDSIIYLHFDIIPASYEDISATACNSFTYNGITYTESGDYTFNTDTISVVVRELYYYGEWGYNDSDGNFISFRPNGWSNLYDEYNYETDDYTYYYYDQNGVYHPYLGETILYTDSIPACKSVTLHLTINHSTTGDTTAVACDSYTWNDSTYTSSGDYTQTFTAANGCDSVVTLHLTITNTDHTDFTDVACDNYTWNGITYTESGDHTQTLTNTAGCDSVVTLHLTVNSSDHTELTAAACGQYVWLDSTYTESGNYSVTYTNAAGCDSVVTLHLTINPIPQVAIMGSTTICPGGGTMLTATGADAYLWSNYSSNPSIPVNMFGIYSVTGTTSAGCFNSASVTVLVATPPVITITGNTDLCAGESATLTANGGVTYMWSNASTDSALTVNAAGSYQVIGYDENGCDGMSSVTVNVWQPAASSLYITSFDSCYTWFGTPYCQSGDYTHTLQTIHGCDSVVTLHLTIMNTDYTDYTDVACDSYTWNDTTYTQSGDYTQTFTNAAGCDSVVTLHLTITNTDYTDYTDVACDSYTWNDTTYTQSGDYTQTFTNAAGCDSVVTLHLTVMADFVPQVTVNGTLTACGNETVTLSVPGNYHDYLWSTGDTTAAITAGSAGYYWVTIGDGNGCTSVSEQVHVGVSELVSETPALCMVGVVGNHNLVVWEELTDPDVVGYQLYRENGQANVFEPLTFVPAGIANAYEDITADPSIRAYRYRITAVDTCGGETPMSEYHKTVHLTINQGLGNSYNLIWTPYEGFGFASYRLYRGTANNNLQLIQTMPSTLTSFTDNNPSGDALFYQIEVVMDGSCVQHTRDITFTGARSNIVYNGTPVTTEVSVSACDSYDWNGQHLTSSGDYTQSFTSPLGYDSVVTLHLTVNNSTSSEFTIITEDSCYTWNTQTYCTSGDYTQTLQTVHGCDSVVTLHLTITVGIDDHNGFDFKVYPNPTNGVVNVQCTMNNVQFGDVELQLVDAYGRLLRSSDVVETQNFASLQTDTHGSSVQTQIDLSRYASGIYFVKAVADGKTVAVRKVVKQ